MKQAAGITFFIHRSSPLAASWLPEACDAVLELYNCQPPRAMVCLLILDNFLSPNALLVSNSSSRNRLLGLAL